jgi:hypothetical protein
VFYAIWEEETTKRTDTAGMINADKGRMDKKDEANIRFSKFCESA